MMTSIVLNEDIRNSSSGNTEHQIAMSDTVASLLFADLNVKGTANLGTIMVRHEMHSSESDASFEDDEDDEDEVDCDDEDDDDDDDDCNSAASDSSSHGPCMMMAKSSGQTNTNGTTITTTNNNGSTNGIVAASVEGGGYGTHFFEGAEKRLALYLSPTTEKSVKAEASGDSGRLVAPDLRKVSRLSWEKMLDLVNCRILSIISNDHIDAYLLSESSMFVSKNRVIIKTCGTTTLLHCLEQTLQLVKKAGFDLIEDVFYSHKNLLVPSLQMHPHDSFRKESKYLDKVFNGFAHLFGHINSDHWYLYTLDNRSQSGSDDDEDDSSDDLLVQAQHSGQRQSTLDRCAAGHNSSQMTTSSKNEPSVDRSGAYSVSDRRSQTPPSSWSSGPALSPANNDHFKFEMIMEELSQKVMNYFVRSQHHSGVTAAEITRKAGIDSLIPGMQIDDYLFTPCGYSMNGLLGKHYMTIHITPEPDFSYVSLETDMPQSSYPNLIGKLIHLFKPGKFMVNLMEPCQDGSPLIEDTGAVAGTGTGTGTGLKRSGYAAAAAGQLTSSKGNGQNHQTKPSGPGPDNIELTSLFEELQNSGPTGAFVDYRQCDLQMIHYKHCDVVFARYVAEGIS